MKKSVSIIVTGKVQGVYFRQSTKALALQSGVCGQVQNLKDGSVHIIASGTEEQLAPFITWCHQGPPAASVDSVSITEIPFREFESFQIKRF